MATKSELLKKIDTNIAERIGGYDNHPESDDLFALFEDIVFQDDSEAFYALIDAGANVNLQNKYGWTLLHIAIRRDRRDMVAYLLENGADIDKTDGVGWTPLMESIMDDMPELCGYLLEKGADVTIANLRGATAPMLVQKFGRTNMAHYFR
jgi:ankyrin repeat protein